MWNNPPNVYDFLLLAHDQETIIKEHLNTRRKIGIEFLSGISTTDYNCSTRERIPHSSSNWVSYKFVVILHFL